MKRPSQASVHTVRQRHTHTRTHLVLGEEEVGFEELVSGGSHVRVVVHQLSQVRRLWYSNKPAL